MRNWIIKGIPMTYLTVPLSAQNICQLKEQTQNAFESGAQMLEFRSDYIENLDLEKLGEAIEILKEITLPIIVTCRDSKEGGQNDLPQSLRTQILCAAIRLGADYIDCEYANYKKHEVANEIEAALSNANSCRLVLSCHNFKSTFDDLRVIYDSIISVCSHAIPKIVYTAKHINDCFECFDLYRESDGDLIVLCMGEAGIITRILAKKFGALLTFTSLDDGTKTASGQVSISQMRDLYRYDSIDKDTQIYGIIAAPVAHSMSPAIHNACFAQAKLNKVYLPMLVDGDELEFNEFVDMVRLRSWLDFRGFSVSIPHKENALKYLINRGQTLEPLASEIGSINTIMIGDGSAASGFNTDYKGAMDALVESIGGDKNWLNHKHAAIIGAGGVARAIVAGLIDRDCHVTIYNRTTSRAHRLAEEFACYWSQLEQIGGEDWNPDVVINCTSVGMCPNIENTPVPSKSLSDKMVVFDTIYNPIETLLLEDAKKAGAKIVSGVDMFVAQAMEQFVHFTNEKGDQELMRKTVFDWL